VSSTGPGLALVLLFAAGMLMTGPLVYGIALRVLKQSPENESWLRKLDHSPDQDGIVDNYP